MFKRLSLMVIVMVLSLTMIFAAGCSSNSIKEMPADSTNWRDLQFTAKGLRVNYNSKFTLKDLENLGYKLNAMEKIALNKTMNPGDNYEVIIHDSTGKEDAFAVRLVNNGTEEVKIMECPIHAIVGGNLPEGSDLTLNNGIKANMTKDEITKIMGEPDATEEANGGLFWKYIVDESKGQYLMLRFKDGSDNLDFIVLFYEQ